jgi:uncharacterized Zn finger protein
MIIIFSAHINISVFSVILKEDKVHNPGVQKPARSKGRKDYGSSWWGREWLRPIESVCGEKASSQGRTLAQEGMIYDVDIHAGLVRAKAEGPAGEEHRVMVRFDRVSGIDREKVFSLVSEPLVSLALLSNELPQDHESAGFESLFGRFNSSCTCPDKSSPCMHVAAVFYVLCGEIDHAPQMLFFLRGISNEELLSCIRGIAPGKKNKGSQKKDGVN